MNYVQNALSKITGLLFYGAAVRRCHTNQLSRDNTVGEHTCRVMLLYWQLCRPTIGLNSNVMECILLHDMAEYVTGDIPSPIKRRMTAVYPNDIQCMEEHFLRTVGFPYTSETALLTDYEKALVAVLDCLDLLILCWQERHERGNHTLYRMHHTASQIFVSKYEFFKSITEDKTTSHEALENNIWTLARTFMCTTGGACAPKDSFGSVLEFYK